jgi:hypothetical protein
MTLVHGMHRDPLVVSLVRRISTRASSRSRLSTGLSPRFAMPPQLGIAALVDIDDKVRPWRLVAHAMTKAADPLVLVACRPRVEDVIADRKRDFASTERPRRHSRSHPWRGPAPSCLASGTMQRGLHDLPARPGNTLVIAAHCSRGLDPPSRQCAIRCAPRWGAAYHRGAPGHTTDGPSRKGPTCD